MAALGARSHPKKLAERKGKNARTQRSRFDAMGGKQGTRTTVAPLSRCKTDHVKIIMEATVSAQLSCF